MCVFSSQCGHFLQNIGDVVFPQPGRSFPAAATLQPITPGGYQDPVSLQKKNCSDFSCKD